MSNSHPNAPPVAARVAHIAGMMRRLEWVRGSSGEALAAEWGLSLSAVKLAAAEAHRIVCAEVLDPAGVKVDVAIALRTVLNDALKESAGAQIQGQDRDGEVVFLAYDPNKSRKTVIDASKTWAMIAGSMVTKHEITGANGGPIQSVDVSKLTDEQLQRLARGEPLSPSAGGDGDSEASEEDGNAP